MRIYVCLLALGATACGDPRLEFIGTYKGPASTLVRFSDGSSEKYPKGEVTLSITAPEGSDKLVFNGKCGMTATVRNDLQFVLDKKACPSERVSLGTISCDLVETITGGTGTRDGTTLSISYFGDSILSRCSDGGPNDSANYTSEMTVTRQ